MSKPNTLNECDIAWAAGLYEGEGSVSIARVGSCPGVSISMTDIEPLQSMQRIFGGKITGPYNYSKGKPVWRWSIYRWENVNSFYEAIRARLSPRRIGQFDKALEKKPFRLRVKRNESCGNPSYASYGRHYRNGETPCTECRQKALEYRSKWVSKQKAKVNE